MDIFLKLTLQHLASFNPSLTSRPFWGFSPVQLRPENFNFYKDYIWGIFFENSHVSLFSWGSSDRSSSIFYGSAQSLWSLTMRRSKSSRCLFRNHFVLAVGATRPMRWTEKPRTSSKPSSAVYYKNNHFFGCKVGNFLFNKKLSDLRSEHQNHMFVFLVNFCLDQGFFSHF